MKIVVIGSGYVGLVTGACLASLGLPVTCVDIDQEKIAKLKRGEMPLFETGLKEIVDKGVADNKLFFDTSIDAWTDQAGAYFICVGTPTGADNKADLSYLERAIRDISQKLKHYAIIINKSTVPVGTGQLVKNIIKENYSGDFDVVSNPEFLRQGQAVTDFLRPDRIVIGTETNRAKELMALIYQSFDCPILQTDLKTAELIKYASNSFLATSISFINSMADLCEQVGADVCQVAEGMRLDKRIGERAFLDAGIGYGGSCFPKDVKALMATARDYNRSLTILEKAEEVNQNRVQLVVDKVKSLVNDINGAVVAVWGLTFKSETDDLRESPALEIIKLLIDQGAVIKAYDPLVKKLDIEKVSLSLSALEAAEESDLLLITNQWPEFKNIDKMKLIEIMKNPNIIDGRNIFQPDEMKSLGFNYLGIGRG